MAEPVVFTRNGLARGATAVLPLTVSCAAFAMVYGLVAGEQGITPLETLLLSLIVFAGASLFLTAGFWQEPLPTLTLVGLVLIVNLRHLLMAPTLRRWLTRIPAIQAYASAFFMVDESWALSLVEERRGGRDAAFMMGAGLVLYVAWSTGAVIGRLFGGLVPEPERYGLDFLGTAFFLAILAGFWRSRADLVPWLVAAVASLAAWAWIPGSWYIVIGALAGSLAGTVRRG